MAVKIWLDAGHGGTDSGATGNGVMEKDVNLTLISAINDFLRDNYDNVETKMTRDTDVFVTLKDRTDRANEWGADFFLSCHVNANDNTAARGFGSYTYTGTSGRTKSAQNVIHAEVLRACPEFQDFGQRQEDFHVLRETKMPALLTENGFVTNTADARLISSRVFIQRLAEAHCRGLASFFGLTRKETDTVAEPTITGAQAPANDYIGHWARTDIDRVIANNMMTVDENGNFSPDAPLTRAMMATILSRLIDRGLLK